MPVKRKIHVGPKGGRYYISKGRKVYLKKSTAAPTKRRPTKKRAPSKKKKTAPKKPSVPKVPALAPGDKGISFSWFVPKEHQNAAAIAAWYRKNAYTFDTRFKVGPIRASKHKGFVRVTASMTGPRSATKIDWDIAKETVKDPDDDGNHPLNGELVYPLAKGFRP